MKTVLALVACIVFAVVNAEPKQPWTAAQRTLTQLTELDEINEAVKNNPSELNAKWNNRLSAQSQAMKRICIGNDDKLVADEVINAYTADYKAACALVIANWHGKGFDLGGDWKTIRNMDAYKEFSKVSDPTNSYGDLLKEYEELYRAEATNASPSTLVSERMDIIDEMLDPIIAADDAFEPTYHAFKIYYDSQVMAQVQAVKRICVGNNLDQVDKEGKPKVNAKTGLPYEISEPAKLNNPEYKKVCEVFDARWLKDSPTGKPSLKAEFGQAMKENGKAWEKFAEESDLDGYKDWLRAYEAEYRQAATAA